MGDLTLMLPQSTPTSRQLGRGRNSLEGLSEKVVKNYALGGSDLRGGL